MGVKKQAVLQHKHIKIIQITNPQDSKIGF